jgi:hypothetical protein
MIMVFKFEISARPRIVALRKYHTRRFANRQLSARPFNTYISLTPGKGVAEPEQQIIQSMKASFHILLKSHRHQFGEQIHAPAILAPQQEQSLDRCRKLEGPHGRLTRGGKEKSSYPLRGNCIPVTRHTAALFSR